MITLRADTELVMVAWIATLPQFTTSMVGTRLPEDNTTWAASGFVTVTPGGGDDQVHTELRNPVVSVDTWAINPASTNAPWGHARALMEAIRKACYPRTQAEKLQVSRLLTLPGGFPTARIHSIYPQTGPRRVPDPGGAAHISTDFVVNWVDQS